MALEPAGLNDDIIETASRQQDSVFWSKHTQKAAIWVYGSGYTLVTRGLHDGYTIITRPYSLLRLVQAT